MRRENRLYLAVALLALVLGLGPRLWSSPFDSAAEAVRRLSLWPQGSELEASSGLSPLERSLLDENRRLREAFALVETLGEQAVVGRVVRREPEHWWQSLWITLELSGPKPEGSALVFTEHGLVGYLEPAEMTDLSSGRGAAGAEDAMHYLARVRLLTAGGVRLAVSFPGLPGLFFLEGGNRAQFRLQSLAAGQALPKDSSAMLLTAGSGELFTEGYPAAEWSAQTPQQALSLLRSTPGQVVVWWR